MDGKHVLLDGLRVSEMITSMLFGDLTDADLLVRPVAGANHYAWQLGHLIGSMKQMGEMVQPGSMPALPDGFVEKYTKETAGNDNRDDFLTKDEYLELLSQQRDATRKLINDIDVNQFDEPGPEPMRELVPTVGDVLHLMSLHEIMHLGQLSVIRRQLGKPVMF